MAFLNEVRDTVLGLLGRVGLGGRGTLFGVLFGLVSFFGTIALTGAVLVRLPPDYLTNPESVRARVTTVRARVLRLLRHLLGVLLILIGLILSIPGVPGQGLLTILAGLFISEIPGTNRLLRRLLRSPKVLAAVNALRGRYKHPPLEAP
jgi:hypothetical protein